MNATPPTIEEEIDREVYAIYRDRLLEELAKARNMADHWHDRIERLVEKLDIVDHRMLPPAPKNAAPRVVGKGGRIKKGATQELVQAFLKNANGVGATISQVVKGTGTTTSTARRALVNLKSEGKVTHGDDARWHWKKDPMEDPMF